jgi:ATP-dependent Clp protease ATP-binding subunit ClpC
MFLGPTGVGKTYLAKKLAEEMFGSADALIRIDMSEYSESFNTSRLVGAPPGYVGYEEGGQLTERVRRKPYSIVLLDEIEKANANVFNMLLQVMDEGRLTDGNGRLVDFRNTIIIMTSNAGTKQLKDFGNGIGFSPITDTKAFASGIIEKALKKQFAPEFLNRLDEIIMFEQLDMEAVKQILDIELKSVYQRIESLGYKLTISDEYMDKIVKEGYDVQYGARPLRRAIQTHVEDVVCQKILNESEVHEIAL